MALPAYPPPVPQTAPPGLMGGAPMGGAGMDPLYDLEPVEVIGPDLPPEYREAPKPRITWTVPDAQAEQAAHGLRLAQAREYAQWLSGEKSGLFADDMQAVRDGKVEPFHITTLRADHEYIVGTVASMDLYLTLAGRDLTESAEALAVEDAALYFRLCEIRQHAIRWGASLKWAEPNHLQRYGMLVGLDTLDPDNPECGLRMSLIDPLTVFPVWGGDGGIDTVYRVYQDTPQNILGTYGGKYGREYDRVRRIVRGVAGTDAGGRLKPDQLLTVTECWNRDWCQVVLEDEKELCNRRHGYAENPFTIVYGGFDQPPGVSAGVNQPTDAYELNTLWGQITISDRATDIARSARPFQWRKLRAHAQREATAARAFTLLRDFPNPTWIHEMDPMTKHLNTADIKAEPGHVIEVTLGNKLSTLVKAPGADLIAPVETLHQINAEQGPWSQINAGGIPPQTSDSAIGTMLELGGAAQSVIVQTLELFAQLRGEARLRRWRDWGKALGPDGQRGSIPIPQQPQYAGTYPPQQLTPEILKRTGCYLQASLFHWRANPGLAQYVMQLRTPGGASGAPLISDETARRTLRIVQDPDREAFRIEDEMVNAMPAIAVQRTLKRIDREIAAEIEAGDYENADALMVAGIELEFERQKQLMAGMAAPPTPPPGAGGETVPPAGDASAAGGAAPPQAPDAQGLSMPQMGDAVGMNGGRPQAGQEPQGMQSATTVTAPR